MSEWPRPVRLDRLGGLALDVAIEAAEAERAALAVRFGLRAIDALAAEAALVRDGDLVTAEGRVTAAVVQACVATGDDVPARVEAPFALRFVPEGPDEVAEMELDEGELDTLPYTGGAIDLGEAAAQTLALALDPWPRAPDADARLRDAGVLDEEAASPFAVLKGLGGAAPARDA